MRVGFQTAFFAVLVGVAIVYFAVPARAQGSEGLGADVFAQGPERGADMMRDGVRFLVGPLPRQGRSGAAGPEAA